MKKFISTLLLLGIFCLGGCSTLDMQKIINQLDQNRDASVAQSIENARIGPISLRSNSLENRPKTIAALVNACQKGIYTEVLLYQSNTSAGSSFAGSCVSVYLSPDPRLSSQEILMVSSFTYVSGNYVSMKPDQLQQEIGYRNYIRMTSTSRY